jgi:hypothetical protein
MRLLAFIFLVTLLGCRTNTKMAQTDSDNEFVPQYTAGPRALVYKTKGDYANLVPVLLSEDRTKIVSYPHPSDLKSQSGYPFPTALNKNYLLDNRGIGSTVAFLKLTYEEYAKLEQAPSIDEMYSMILDKDPLAELCDCGNKKAFKNITDQLNGLIDKDKLNTTCKKLK